MEFTDPDNPGFGPGQRQIRFRTKNRPPVFKTCATRTASGELTAYLNAKGEVYFGTHHEDVNDAIALAVSEANAAAAAMANDAEWCEDQCAVVQGSGSETIGDASATAELVIGSFDEGDPICDPESNGGQSPHLTITAQAPGKPGVDLRPLIESITAGGASGIPPNSLGAFNKFKEDVLSEIDLVVTPATPMLINYQLWPAGYPDAGYINVTINSSFSYVSVGFSCPSMVPGFDNSETVVVGVAIEYVEGTFASGSTVIASGYYELLPLVRWGDDPETGSERVSGAIPSGISLKNENNPPPRSINETIPLTNSPDAEVWIPEASFNADPANKLVASGSFALSYSYYKELVDPGYRPKCQYNLHYRSRDPGLPLCGDEPFYWDLVTLPETRYPPGKQPPCRIKVHENYQPPTV